MAAGQPVKQGRYDGAGGVPVKVSGRPTTPSSKVGAGCGMDWTRILAYVTGTVDRELLAGWTDFFIAEMLTLRVLVTCYVLFFIHLETPPGGYRRDHRSSA